MPSLPSVPRDRRRGHVVAVDLDDRHAGREPVQHVVRIPQPHHERVEVAAVAGRVDLLEAGVELLLFLLGEVLLRQLMDRAKSALEPPRSDSMSPRAQALLTTSRQASSWRSSFSVRLCVMGSRSLQDKMGRRRRVEGSNSPAAPSAVVTLARSRSEVADG